MRYLSEMARSRYLWLFWLTIAGLGVPLGAADLSWPESENVPLAAGQLPAYRVSFAAYSFIATEEAGQAVITVTVDPPPAPI